jgi:glycerol uptake facilitator-like aquaporin
MLRTAPCFRTPLARAADEFALTTVLLFIAVTIVRWLRDPASPLYIADLNGALAVIGVLSGAILIGLILGPAGRRSGGHMNPAVTVGLWLMDAFPGRSVPLYVLAQLAGSVAGTGLARLLWGRSALSLVGYGAVKPAPTWHPESVFIAEAGAVTLLILVVGLFLAHRGLARLLPQVIGLFVSLVIAILGPLSGGSINPARQLGPAAFSGQNTCLWIYLVAPIVGAVLGALAHRLLIRLPRTREHALMPGTRTLGRGTAEQKRFRQSRAPASPKLFRWRSLAPAGRDTIQEVEGQFGYLVACAFQHEVPAVEQVDLRIRYVVGEGAGAVRPEGWISLAPGSQNRRAPAPQVLVQGRVERRIRCVVADQRELDRVVTRP